MLTNTALLKYALMTMMSSLRGPLYSCLSLSKCHYVDTCTPYSLETSKIVSVARNNTIASSLYRKWDYAKYRVGKYERNWTDGVGQVILTHPDGKELTREHVEVLYASSEAACELVGRNQDPYSPQMKKKEFQEYFTPRNFERFWHLYSMDKLNGPTWSRRTPQLDFKGDEMGNTQVGKEACTSDGERLLRTYRR